MIQSKSLIRRSTKGITIINMKQEHICIYKYKTHSPNSENSLPSVVKFIGREPVQAQIDQCQFNDN
jgi:hypothetical protein